METIETIRAAFMLPENTVSIKGGTGNSAYAYDVKGGEWSTCKNGTITSIQGVVTEGEGLNTSDVDHQYLFTYNRAYDRNPTGKTATVQLISNLEVRNGGHTKERIITLDASKLAESGISYEETITDSTGMYMEIVTPSKEIRSIDTRTTMGRNGQVYTLDSGRVYEIERVLLSDGTVELTLRRTDKGLNRDNRVSEVVYKGAEEVTFQDEDDESQKKFSELTDDEKARMRDMIGEIKKAYERRYEDVYINRKKEDSTNIVDSSYFAELATRLQDLYKGMIEESLVEGLELSPRDAIEAAKAIKARRATR